MTAIGLSGRRVVAWVMVAFLLASVSVVGLVAVVLLEWVDVAPTPYSLPPAAQRAVLRELDRAGRLPEDVVVLLDDRTWVGFDSPRRRVEIDARTIREPQAYAAHFRGGRSINLMITADPIRISPETTGWFSIGVVDRGWPGRWLRRTTILITLPGGVVLDEWSIRPAALTGTLATFFPPWAVIVLSPVILLRLNRRRHGRCPACAHDLRGGLDAGCPECGWNRAAA